MTSGELKSYLANHFKDHPEWSNPKFWVRNYKHKVISDDDLSEKIGLNFCDLNDYIHDGSPLQDENKYILRCFSTRDDSFSAHVATDESDEKIVHFSGTED